VAISVNLSKKNRKNRKNRKSNDNWPYPARGSLTDRRKERRSQQVEQEENGDRKQKTLMMNQKLN
jgi:hypothetical protein